MLIILIPLTYFGQILLRIDILLLFTIGIVLAEFKDRLQKSLIILFGLSISSILFFYFPEYFKYGISFTLFVSIIDLKIKFFKTGGYSYLLHLYHSPIMIIAFPILNKFISNPLLNITLQIVISLFLVYLLYLTTRRFKTLRIISGGR